LVIGHISSSEIRSMVHIILQIILHFSDIWYSQQPWVFRDMSSPREKISDTNTIETMKMVRGTSIDRDNRSCLDKSNTNSECYDLENCNVILELSHTCSSAPMAKETVPSVIRNDTEPWETENKGQLLVTLPSGNSSSPSNLGIGHISSSEIRENFYSTKEYTPSSNQTAAKIE